MGLILLLIYNLLFPVLAPVYLIIFLFSRRRALLKNLLSELGQRLAFSVPSFDRPPLWLHAASVGEVRVLEALLPRLKEKYPGVPLLITTSTNSGKQTAAKLTRYACLLPIDFYPCIKHFLNKVNPAALIIAETELWPNLLYAAGKAGVPAMLLNARLSAGTFNLYSRLKPLTNLMFSGIKTIAAQSRTDLDRYSGLGNMKKKLVLTGNIKHDLVFAPRTESSQVSEFIASSGWNAKEIICAASTHAGEEDIILRAFARIRIARPLARFIIAPRHPETAGLTLDKLRRSGLIAPRWSSHKEARPDPDCLLMDELGRMQEIYAVSSVVFVGGTLDNTGGHNVLEPAAFSKPVIFGPNIKNTLEGAEALQKNGGGFLIQNSEELAEKIIYLLSNPDALNCAGKAAQASLQSLQGATLVTLKEIETALGPSLSQKS